MLTTEKQLHDGQGRQMDLQQYSPLIGTDPSPRPIQLRFEVVEPSPESSEQLYQPLARTYFSPMQHSDIFQTSLEENEKFGQRDNTPRHIEKFIAKLGTEIFNLTRCKDTSLDIWLELVGLVESFLSKNAEGGNQAQKGSRFAIANLLLATVCLLFAFVLGICLRAFVGRMLGLLFFFLIFGAWITNN